VTSKLLITICKFYPVLKLIYNTDMHKKTLKIAQETCSSFLIYLLFLTLMVTTILVIQDMKNIYSLLQLDNPKYFNFLKLLRKFHSPFSLPCFLEASSTGGFSFKLTNLFSTSLLQDLFSLVFWYGKLLPVSFVSLALFWVIPNEFQRPNYFRSLVLRVLLVALVINEFYTLLLSTNNCTYITFT